MEEIDNRRQLENNNINNNADNNQDFSSRITKEEIHSLAYDSIPCIIMVLLYLL